MKRLITLMLLLAAAVTFAADMSIQQFFGKAPKEMTPQGSTRVITIRDGIIRQLSYSSVGANSAAFTSYTSTINKDLASRTVSFNSYTSAINKDLASRTVSFKSYTSSAKAALAKKPRSYTYSGAYAENSVPIYYGDTDPSVQEPYIWVDTSAIQGGGVGLLPDTDPTVTGSITSPEYRTNGADGTHYVLPYNSIPFSGVPQEGMLQTTTTGLRLYSGGSWGPVAGSDYTLPTASTTVLGGVKVDGSTITMTNGVASATVAGSSGYVSPPAYSDSTCTVGSWSIDSGFWYGCKATNTWDRTALAAWSNPTPDMTPDSFTFASSVDVAVNTLITSTPITVTGINTATPITVTNGAYDINASGNFVTTAGTVSAGNTVRAQHTSSASNLTSVNTDVTIGGITRTFTSTTAAPATAYKTGLADYWDFTTASATGLHASTALTNSGAVLDATGAVMTNDYLYKTATVTGETGAMSVLIRYKRNVSGDLGRLALFKRGYTGFALTNSAAEILIGAGSGNSSADATWGVAADNTKGRMVSSNDTNWHLACVTLSAGTNKTITNFYFDGTSVTTAATLSIGSGDAASDVFMLGGKWLAGVPAEPSPDNSTISHVALWNRELTAGECAAATTGTGYLYGGW